jgi:ribonuclease P protein component
MTVSVPKRNFKKAVDRNRLKRLVREAYRKNKPVGSIDNYALFFIFMGRQKVDYNTVEYNLKSLLRKLD